MLTATVDARGQLVAMTVNTTRYRTMAPAELATAITEVVAQAQREMSEEIESAFAPLKADKDRLTNMIKEW